MSGAEVAVWLWWTVAHAAPEDRGTSLLEATTHIVETLGGRPARTEAGDRAQAWAEASLRAAGWPATRVAGPDGYVIGCREGQQPHTLLFLAHTDTVHADVVGALDNAASMAVLLALADALAAPGAPVPPRAVCLAFPDSEEIGLIGSRRLAGEVEAHVRHPLDQVMSLDLVGRGQTTHNGLGPAWGASRLRALLAVAPAEVPFVYRALSQGHPEFERSDHHVFGLRGIPSSHLMGRAEAGVLWTYHTRDDVPATAEPAALADAFRVVWSVAFASPLPSEPVGEWAMVVPFTHLVVPGWGVGLVVLSCALGTVVARVAAHRRVAEPVPAAPAWAGLGLGLLGAAAGIVVAAAGRPFGLALAGFVVLAGWSGLALGALGSPSDHPGPATAVAAVFGMLTVIAVGVGLPLLAVPLSMAAVATAWIDRMGAIALPVALWPALYLVRGDAVRELDHHMMLSASPVTWTVLLALLGSPLVVALAGVTGHWRTGLRMAAGVTLLFAVAAAWMTPVMAPPYERGARYLGPNDPPLPPPGGGRVP